MFAAVTGNLYRALLFGHIVSILVAFAPVAVHPLLSAQIKAEGDDAGLRRQLARQAANGRRLYLPALVVAGGFGLGMVLTSDGVWGFGQTWVSLAFLVWLALAGVVSGLLLPSERRAAAGDGSAERLVDRGGQIATVLLLVMLYLMIWKPGA